MRNTQPEIKQPKPHFFNDPKLKEKIEIGGPVFKKGIR